MNVEKKLYSWVLLLINNGHSSSYLNYGDNWCDSMWNNLLTMITTLSTTLIEQSEFKVLLCIPKILPNILSELRTQQKKPSAV